MIYLTISNKKRCKMINLMIHYRTRAINDDHAISLFVNRVTHNETTSESLRRITVASSHTAYLCAKSNLPRRSDVSLSSAFCSNFSNNQTSSARSLACARAQAEKYRLRRASKISVYVNFTRELNSRGRFYRANIRPFVRAK